MTRRKRKYTFEKWEMNSKFEHTVATDLRNRGVDFDYECESFPWMEKLPRAQCVECGQKSCFVDRSYTPDFFLPNGIIVETKGRFTAHDRKIAAAMKEQHPSLDIRLVFQSDNWLNSNKKSRYSDWAERKGIPWAVRRIPEEWTTE